MTGLPQVLAMGLTLLIGRPAALDAPPLAAKLGGVVSDACAAFRSPVDEAESTQALEAPIRVLTKAGVLYLPRGFRAAKDGSFDLVVHFHGSADLLGPAMEQKGFHAALLTDNRGISSSAYEWPFADPSALDRAIDVVVHEVAARDLVGRPHIRRVALSAWSAGHGAVYRLLAHPEVAERVDAVLLEDALHAAFIHPATREIDDVKMAPFVRFGKAAAEGRKLFAVTHSAIPTFQFASTTETATYLAHALGAPVKDASAVLAGHMTERRSADLGSFHLLGFEGTSKEAHCDHFRGIGDTILGLLAARWSQKD